VKQIRERLTLITLSEQEYVSALEQASSGTNQEKARRFEVKTLWVTKIILPLAGVLVGIIGALTGLVAVFQHWK
jgi:hypothetical protein